MNPLRLRKEKVLFRIMLLKNFEIFKLTFVQRATVLQPLFECSQVDWNHLIMDQSINVCVVIQHKCISCQAKTYFSKCFKCQS